MAKIFKLFPEQIPTQNHNEADVGRDGKEEAPEESSVEDKSEDVDGPANIISIDSQVSGGSELSTEEERFAYHKQLTEKLHAFIATSLNKEQYSRFSSLKNQFRGLKGKVSRSAYSEWYASLSKRDLSELLPILDNLNDADFTSHPAYAFAFIKVVEEKDLAAVKEKRLADLKKNREEE